MPAKAKDVKQCVLGLSSDQKDLEDQEKQIIISNVLLNILEEVQIVRAGDRSVKLKNILCDRNNSGTTKANNCKIKKINGSVFQEALNVIKEELKNKDQLLESKILQTSVNNFNEFKSLLEEIKRAQNRNSEIKVRVSLCGWDQSKFDELAGKINEIICDNQNKNDSYLFPMLVIVGAKAVGLSGTDGNKVVEPWHYAFLRDLIGKKDGRYLLPACVDVGDLLVFALALQQAYNRPCSQDQG